MKQMTETGATSIARFIDAMQSARVDVIGISDSNQLRGGFGWDHGFQFALADIADMWATGMLGAFENSGGGAGTGYKYSTAGPDPVFEELITDLPDELAAYGTGIFPLGSGMYNIISYLAANNAVAIDAGCPLDPTAALTFELHYGTFDAGHVNGAGDVHTATPAIRLGVPGFDTLATFTAINALTGSLGMAVASKAVAAGAGHTALECRWANQGTAVSAFGMFFLYSRAYLSTATAGFSYTTLAGYGGQSTRAVASALLAASDTSLSYLFGQMREKQGTIKRFLFVINEGLNDRNETLASLGPAAVADGDSPEAFADNTLAIVNRVMGIWEANGWNTTEVSWLFMPSHPVATPDDADLITYRAAAATLAASIPQARSLDLSTLTTHAEMVTNSWYIDAEDFNHLSQDGYEDIAALAVDALQIPFVVSATIDATGLVLTVVCSENMEAGDTPDTSGFTLSGGVALTYSGVSTTTITFDIGRVIKSNEHPAMNFTQPAGANGWQDADGHDLESFSGFQITNNSAVADTTPPFRTFSRPRSLLRGLRTLR